MRKHLNVFLISNDDAAFEETKLEFALALNSIRARCYSLNSLNRLKHEMDWEMKKSFSEILPIIESDSEYSDEDKNLITEKLIQFCDIVVYDNSTPISNRKPFEISRKYKKTLFGVLNPDVVRTCQDILNERKGTSKDAIR